MITTKTAAPVVLVVEYDDDRFRFIVEYLRAVPFKQPRPLDITRGRDLNSILMLLDGVEEPFTHVVTSLSVPPVPGGEPSYPLGLTVAKRALDVNALVLLTTQAPELGNEGKFTTSFLSSRDGFFHLKLGEALGDATRRFMLSDQSTAVLGGDHEAWRRVTGTMRFDLDVPSDYFDGSKVEAAEEVAVYIRDVLEGPWAADDDDYEIVELVVHEGYATKPNAAPTSRGNRAQIEKLVLENLTQAAGPAPLDRLIRMHAEARDALYATRETAGSPEYIELQTRVEALTKAVALWTDA